MRTRQGLGVAFLLGLLAMLTALAGGCTRRGEERESYPIQGAVSRYNRALIEVYRTGRIDPLDSAATERETRKVSLVLYSLLAEEKLMEAQLKQLELVKVEIAGSVAYAWTVEDWVYQHRDVRSHEPRGPLKTQRYELKYRLARKGEDWTVASVEYSRAPGPGKNGRG